MGALITCCRKPKTPSNSQTDIGVVNEEVNIRNGEVVVETRNPEAKYEYNNKNELEGSLQLNNDGEVVEELMEVKSVKAVHSAPPPRQTESINVSGEVIPAESGSGTVVRETRSSVSGRSSDGEFRKTTIVRESVETKTVTQRSSIPMLKPAAEGKPRPKVVIVREY